MRKTQKSKTHDGMTTKKAGKRKTISKKDISHLGDSERLATEKTRNGKRDGEKEDKKAIIATISKTKVSKGWEGKEGGKRDL